MDWFLYDNGLRLERVKYLKSEVSKYQKQMGRKSSKLKGPSSDGYASIFEGTW